MPLPCFPVLIVIAITFLTSCGNSGPIEITEVREFDLESDFEVPVLAESDLHRFRYRTGKSESPGVETPGTRGGARLTWTTPEGWKEVAPTPIREVNMRFGENDEGECYLTRLPGQSGGVVANVNRWVGQMGAGALTEEQINALPKKTLFGEEAILVQLDGTYTGFRADPVPDSRLVGLVLAVADSLVTVKMTGPKELVAENEVRFDAFCASLDVRTGN